MAYFGLLYSDPIYHTLSASVSSVTLRMSAAPAIKLHSTITPVTAAATTSTSNSANHAAQHPASLPSYPPRLLGGETR